MSSLRLLTSIECFMTRNHAGVAKSPSPVRFGLISTAAINGIALIIPASSHPDVLVTAVASRSEASAKEYASKHKIPKHYGSYDALLEDKDIDAVYIGLPNSMHAEWARKSLLAGKHVLLEKPFASNAAEAGIIADTAREEGLVCLEAFHYRFHPCCHFVEEVVNSGRYGRVTSIRARMTMPKNDFAPGDIRFNYDLAGGSLMDFAYVTSVVRVFSGGVTGLISDVEKADAVRTSAADARVDVAVEADMKIPVGEHMVDAHISTDMALSLFLGIIPRFWESPTATIEMEEGSIYVHNFCMPHMYHYITVKDKKSGRSKTHKLYKGGPRWGDRGEKWWSSYRYQLEAFVDKVQGKEPAYWISNEDSVELMQSIDAIYDKSGLGARKGPLA